jgi:hypothetical protein
MKHENEDKQNELDEKNWQINILENVLGKSIKTKENHNAAKK